MTLRGLIGAVALLASGCVYPHSGEVDKPVATPPDTARAGWLQVAPSDGLMVVYFRGVPMGNASPEIESCIESEIRSGRPTQRLVSFEAFRRLAFPQLEDRAVPRDPADLGTLFEDPKFRARVAPLGIRWIVFVSGSFESTFTEGGPDKPYQVQDKSTRLDARIVGVDDLSKAVRLAASAKGTSTVAFQVFVGIPIFVYMPVATEGPACHALGQRLAERLNGPSRPGGK